MFPKSDDVGTCLDSRTAIEAVPTSPSGAVVQDEDEIGIEFCDVDDPTGVLRMAYTFLTGKTVELLRKISKYHWSRIKSAQKKEKFIANIMGFVRDELKGSKRLADLFKVSIEGVEDVCDFAMFEATWSVSKATAKRPDWAPLDSSEEKKAKPMTKRAERMVLEVNPQCIRLQTPSLPGS